MRLLLPLLLVSLLGCPPADPVDPILVPQPTHEIGTWPTPEMNALGEEKCDGVDNDGDGAIDEGCGCTQDQACVTDDGTQCLTGVQSCDGNLGECTATSGELGPVAVPGVTVGSVAPAVLTPLDALGPVVTAEVQPKCPGVLPPVVLVVLEAQVPVMRVWALARDDGVAPDAVAGDQVYSAQLINPFGPGVSSQTMTVEVGVRLDEEWHLDEGTLDYQAD